MGIFDVFRKKTEINPYDDCVIDNTKIPDEYKEQAIEVLKNILMALHEKRYTDILNYVDEVTYELDEFIIEMVEERAFDSVDEYGAPCNFKPAYEYHQMNFYPYKDNRGFALEYDLSTDSELMDLCLQLEFLYIDNGLKKVFITIDPQ